MNNEKSAKRAQNYSFEANVQKLMGKAWDKLSEQEKETIHELSECKKGGGPPPPDER